MSTIVGISKQFVPAPIAPAKNLEEALTIIEREKRKETEPEIAKKGKKLPEKTFTEEQIRKHSEELLQFIGAIDWDQEGVSPENISDSHPFKSVFDAIAIIKGDVDNLFQERKRAEEQLRDAEVIFRAIFDNANDGILLADGATKKFYIGNNTICQMLGYSLEEIKNLSVTDIHPKEELPYAMGQFERVLRREIAVAEGLPVKRKDGSVFYADVNTSLVTLAGRTHLLGLFRDITERKQAAEASRKTAALETLIQGYDNFIGDSLSNLLTPIYGHIELCEMRDSIDEIKGEFGNMKGDITKLLTGINTYRKFTKAGESSLGKISSVDISSILDPFLSGQPLKTYGDEEFPIDPKVKLQFTYNPKQKGSVRWEELPSVSGSKLAVATTLQETLINAVESYDPKKGGDVVVSARREDGNLIIKITDNGRGMSNEERDKSQLPFFKVLGVKASGRLGLGAYIARQSAKYCGGDIHIESREGVGTTASISFKVSDEVT
jgi:PAS domain S-box-containing protein